ncbi:LptF/LptG family permease [candidate division NPL-UPA2 bacterium]|nr:LptF/LptG family permease [candidate division NPL-UPA2 bacterium]
MRILDRYIARGFLTCYLCALITFVALYLIVDLFTNSDEWIQAGMPASTIIDYYLNCMPNVFILVGPVALLLATLFALGTLSRNNELTAIAASGISLYRTLLPLLLIAFLVSLVTIFVNELIVPRTVRRANEIKRMRRERNPDLHVYRDIQLYGEEGNMFYIRSFDSRRNILKGLQILKYSKGGSIELRVDAEEAKWSDGRWRLLNGFLRRYDEKGNLEEVQPLRELDIPETPEDFLAGPHRSEELSFRELKGHIETLVARGLPRKELGREVVELHSKVSLPLANLVILLTGIPFALRTRRRGIVAEFGKAIGIGFIYLAFFRLGQFLGQGLLPAVVGAWLANIIFATGGIVLIYKTGR